MTLPVSSGRTTSTHGSISPRTGSRSPQFFMAVWLGPPLPSELPSADWSALPLLSFFFILGGPLGVVHSRAFDETEALSAASRSLQYCVWPSLTPFSIGPV